MNQDENKDLSGEGVSDKFILSSLLPSFAPSPVLKPSEMPTPFPTNIYSSADPSSYPSLLPSQFPTWISHSPSILPTSSPSEITGKPSIPKISRRPTSNPSWQPSQNPTSSSSLHPSKVLSQVPTEAISTNSSQLTHDESEIKFYVLGDVPYNRKGKKSKLIFYYSKLVTYWYSFFQSLRHTFYHLYLRGNSIYLSTASHSGLYYK
jgi:hypothetical protein